MIKNKRHFGKIITLIVAIGVTYAALSSCQSVALLNALVPNDTNSRGAAKDIVYGERQRHKLDIYVPKQTNVTPRPVLVFIYGGGWHSGDKDHYSFAGHAFASSGFVTVLPDYHLAPEVHYPAFLEDTAAALAWTKKNVAEFGGDPTRIFVMGHSAGAYNAVMMALAPEFLARHQMAPSDLAGAIGWSGPYDFLPLDVPSTVAAFGKVPNLEATQPIMRARALTPEIRLPPIYLMHGRDDTSVGVYHTERLTKALREKNTPVVQKIYDKIDHSDPIIGIARPFRGRSKVFSDTLTFLHTHSDEG